MQVHDRDLIARDQALPGLGLVLEPAALLAELRAAWPERELQELRLTYLRYKPQTNCLAAYSLLVDGNRQFIHATAYRKDDNAKRRKVLEKLRGESPLTPVVLPQNIAVRAFPTDRKLDALQHLNGGTTQQDLLRVALVDDSELWQAKLEILRYKPERRLVARLRSPDGSCALLKLYHAGDFERARDGAMAFSQGQVLSAPLLGVHPQERILVWRWLEALPFNALLKDSPALAIEIGRALAALHVRPEPCLIRVARTKEALPLRAAAEQVAYLLPELAVRVRRLAIALDEQLRAAPTLVVPVHGDFSADQVLATPEGAAIIDFDAAALGDPAWDFGTFMAQLERAVLYGTFTAETVLSVRAALQQGYTESGASLPPRISLYTAAGLLRLAPHAFRTRQPDWPKKTLHLLTRAEAFLEPI